MVYHADDMILSPVREILRGPVYDVLVCQDLRSSSRACYLLLAVHDRETAKRLLMVLQDSERGSGEEKPFLKMFTENELLCLLFPYRPDRRLDRFAQGQLVTPQSRERVCVNLVMECLSVPLPYPLLYLALEKENVHLLQDDGVYFTYSFDLSRMDESVGEEPKAALFLAAGCLEAVGVTDLLLNGLTGRYLWISVEVLGAGSAVLRNFRVYSPEDNFFNSFPEVYRTDGDFFRRYLSIFNVMYADSQEKIDALDQYLDLDTAPSALLPVFAHWLGLELDGNFLDDSQLRILLKNAFSLICAKGTRKAIVGVVRILTDAPVYVLERQSSQ